MGYLPGELKRKRGPFDVFISDVNRAARPAPYCEAPERVEMKDESFRIVRQLVQEICPTNHQNKVSDPFWSSRDVFGEDMGMKNFIPCCQAGI